MYFYGSVDSACLYSHKHSKIPTKEKRTIILSSLDHLFRLHIFSTKFIEKRRD